MSAMNEKNPLMALRKELIASNNGQWQVGNCAATGTEDGNWYEACWVEPSGLVLRTRSERGVRRQITCGPH